MDRRLELNDKYTVKILLCYILKSVDCPIATEQLYEIAVGSGILNYFYYTEAVNDLLQEDLAVLQDGQYVLLQKGELCAQLCYKYVPLSFREKLLGFALRYFARLKRESEVVCECFPSENGYLVRCRVLDVSVSEDLMNLTLFAPSKEQAELLREKILENPADLYARIMGYALDITTENE